MESISVADMEYLQSLWLEEEQSHSTQPPHIVVESERHHWKTVRVFVSSTFTDYFHEREILVKHVFPRLRDYCDQRKLNLVEIDLR